MKLQRWLMVLGVTLSLAGAAFVAQSQEQPTAFLAAGAAQKLAASLSPAQRSKAILSFESKERTNWNFVPLQDRERKSIRKGLPLEEMSADQQEAARQLVKSATSDSGFKKATTIMALENLLRDLERNGVNVRNPGWYFFTLFGEPSKTGQWGFRVEGHHLSLNFTFNQGKVTGFTPCFFGANPAEIMAGDRKGEKILPEVDILAQQLYKSLDEEQRKQATHSGQFEEIEQGKSAPNLGNPTGLAHGKMNPKQQEILQNLIRSYLNRVPADIAENEMAEVEKAGLNKVHFAFFREENKPGQPFTYRVQGPTFVIEFLKIQEDSAKNPANHIHSSWRKLKGDFGIPVR